MAFKENFVWGVATSAYQIEGAWNEDGKSESIWDTYTHRRDRIRDCSDADVACDSYHRVEEDLALIEGLGVDAYRFSVAWTRLIPTGVGAVNPKGLDYYNRLINGLLARGITPYLTLYHWDMPQCLQDKGGFLSPEFPEWFRLYAKVIAECFGDRVKNFFTFNEPQCIFGLGHCKTDFAPGLLLSKKEQLSAIHHMLLAHGLAVKELRKVQGASIGYVGCGGVAMPGDASEYQTAYEKFFEIDKNFPCGCVSIYSDPILLGDYPKEYYEHFKDILPDIKEGDMEIISQPVDFFSENCYEGFYVKKGENGTEIIPAENGYAATCYNWRITPEALYYVSKFLYERYKKPIYISENGMAMQDFMFGDGKIHDPARSEYIRTYLENLERASNE